ncbi:MAG: complex I NDUFA9 subunit family protein [Thiotrichales bacterium]|nr:complex I NDUFA9 subunit family protein [Thiotrichales bacterium]
MIINRVCILGGSGFVGKSLANRLAGAGIRMLIPTRNREQKRNDLILLPDTDLIEADIHDPDHLRALFAGCDAVINLVGILNETGRRGQGFQRAHVELTEKIIAACKATGIQRVLQMSALNADAEQGESFYLRSKGQAEDRLRGEHSLKVTCYRPSVIFGPGDSFFNRFAVLLRLSPGFFPLACYRARFAPVYVGDVAELMLRTLDHPASFGQTYELCGPREYTLEELVKYTAACLGLKRCVIPLNDFLSRLQAVLFDFVPGKPFSTDNYLSARKPSVCGHCQWPVFGIQPVAIESVVPDYLARRHFRSRYDKYRKQLHHPG